MPDQTQRLIQLELTHEEAEKLVNMMDAAVRSEGIRTAEHAVPLLIKIRSAVSKSQLLKVLPPPEKQET